MTIEERVDDIGEWRDRDARKHAIRVMRAAVAAAVEAEREALAQRFEAAAEVTVSRDGAEAYRRAARLIRARSNASEAKGGGE